MSRIRLRKFLSTAAVVVTVGILIPGGIVWAVEAGPLASPDQEHRPNDPTGYTTRTTEVPQAADPQAAIDATLAGLDRDLFSEIRIGDAPSADDWQGKWLYATVKGGADADGGWLPSVWEADLAQGGIADRLAGGEANLADVLVGSTIQFETGDGETTPVAGGAGDIISGQSFGDGESDEAITASITTTLTGFGLTPAEIKVLHPLDPAVYVVATIGDLKDIDGRFDEIRATLLGDPARYEGLYLEIDSADGTPIARNATAYRSGTGRLWIAPGYDDIVGAAHGGTPR